jgi:AcrR family transcriptional regulator
MTTVGKANIMQAARELFGEKGFEGASVREISKRAKVNVAMIAYYFGCKEALYLRCLSDFAQEETGKIHAILQNPKDRTDFEAKLRLFVETMMHAYEKDAPLMKILLREMQSDKKKINKELVELTSPFFFNIRSYFQQAIDAKIISKDKSADLVAVFFMGALSNPIHTEIPLKRAIGMTMKDLEFRTQYTNLLLDVFLKGVLP